MTSKDHNKLLGIFFLIQGGLVAFAGVLIAIIYGGLGTMMLTSGRDSEAQTVGGIFIVAGVVVGLFVVVFSIFHLITGWKMYKEAPVGRILGIIASIISLTSFPLGTALGVYGLWFLFGDEGKRFYSGEAGSAGPPPPPNSWQ